MEGEGAMRKGTALTVSLFLLWILFAEGCASPPVYRPDESAYEVWGYYLGTKEGVAVWIRSIKFFEENDGRLYIDVLVVNKRSGPLRVDMKDHRLKLPGRSVLNKEGMTFRVEPGKKKDLELNFKTYLREADIMKGVICIEGLKDEKGRAIEFRIPFRKVFLEQ
jgi:hypothetical protein